MRSAGGHRTGRDGEMLAERHLRDAGYRILERRFRTRRGEIDLIAARDNLIAFVEVKTRRASSWGDPLDAVTPRKQARLTAAAEAYLAANPHHDTAVFRFDVVTVSLGAEGDRPVIEHLEGAFLP